MTHDDDDVVTWKEAVISSHTCGGFRVWHVAAYSVPVLHRHANEGTPSYCYWCFPDTSFHPLSTSSSSNKQLTMSTPILALTMSAPLTTTPSRLPSLSIMDAKSSAISPLPTILDVYANLRSQLGLHESAHAPGDATQAVEPASQVITAKSNINMTMHLRMFLAGVPAIDRDLGERIDKVPFHAFDPHGVNGKVIRAWVNLLSLHVKLVSSDQV